MSEAEQNIVIGQWPADQTGYSSQLLVVLTKLMIKKKIEFNDRKKYRVLTLKKELMCKNKIPCDLAKSDVTRPVLSLIPDAREGHVKSQLWTTINVIKRSFNNSIDRDEWLMANSSIATHYAFSVNLRQISLFASTAITKGKTPAPVCSPK